MTCAGRWCHLIPLLCVKEDILKEDLLHAWRRLKQGDRADVRGKLTPWAAHMAGCGTVHADTAPLYVLPD